MLPLPATPVGDDYRLPAQAGDIQPAIPLDLYLCRACGLAQLRHVVAREVLYGNFIYTTSVSLGLPAHFSAYAEDVARWVGAPAGSLVVDIGSNDGVLLRAFQVRGYRGLGIEPAGDIARRATDSGVKTLARFFGAALAREVRASEGPAAIVTCNNTLANVEDLDDVADGLRELIGDSGVVSIETGYLLDLVQHELFDVIYHEHLSYFAVKPLVPFFRRHGLELVDAQRVPTKGGSIRVLVQKAGGRRSVSSEVARFVAEEEHAHLHVRSGFAKLDAHLDSTRERLEAFLADVRSKRQRIAGYGASVGSTTFLYRLGLGPFLEFLVDDNPAKHGRLAPGTNLPVLPARAILERRPDFVLILSWRYSDPIVSRLETYRAQGGIVLSPWPKWSEWIGAV